MTSKEGQPAGPDSQGKYEATVLDFLEKELASVQPAQKKDHHSEELDALVSDLLKQVMTEADQSQRAGNPLLDEEEEFFADLNRAEEKALKAASLAAPAPSPAPTVPAAPASSVIKPEPASIDQPEPAEAKPAAVFPPVVQAKRGLPAMVAAAAFIVLIGGAGVWFFSGSSRKAPKAAESKPAVAQALKTEFKPVPAHPQPATQTDVPPASQPVPTKTVVATPPKSSPVAPPQPAATASNPGQSEKASPSKGKAEPEPAATAKEEKAVVAPPAPATSAPIPVAAALEKPSPPPAPDRVAPVNPPAAEKNSPAPTAPQVAESSKPATQTESQAPAAVRTLVPAFPISQVSPAYPELALKARASGSVVLDLEIDDQGKVLKATPVGGPAIFYTAAVQAAMKWRYKPASLGGANVKSQSRVTMVFNWKN